MCTHTHITLFPEVILCTTHASSDAPWAYNPQAHNAKTATRVRSRHPWQQLEVGRKCRRHIGWSTATSLEPMGPYVAAVSVASVRLRIIVAMHGLITIVNLVFVVTCVVITAQVERLVAVQVVQLSTSS